MSPTRAALKVGDYVMWGTAPTIYVGAIVKIRAGHGLVLVRSVSLPAALWFDVRDMKLLCEGP